MRTQPGTDGVKMDVCLTNPEHAVSGMELVIANDFVNVKIGDEYVDVDPLTCTMCEVNNDRALNFTCSAAEQPNGDCKVVLLSIGDELINQGECNVLKVAFDVNDYGKTNDCIDMWLRTTSIVADRFGDSLCVTRDPGTLCFITCGDIYPRECDECTDCGDGIVDIFDILEEIDIILGLVTPTDCQIERGNVPTGTLPYCADPGTAILDNINIFDSLVVIDMALGKGNCCDYYYFSEIY